MHVIFVEPRFPTNQKQFVRALREAGVLVTGVGEAPADLLGSELRGWLHDYIQIPNVCSKEHLYDAVRTVQDKGPWVDRLEATVEAHMMTAAEVREACKIPGTSVRTTYLCRDKPAMKEALREAGVPTAQSIGSSSRPEIEAFVATAGYPVIIKPRSGAGAAGTYRCDDQDELDQALSESGVDQGASVAVEEFVTGHEGFYDTITIGGTPVHSFISHYYPNVLEAMRNRWINPQVVTTNRVDASSYEEVKKLGQKVITALGIDTSPTHMEWFFGSKGLKFSEIGCRPPGVSVWDLYGEANEMDLYLEWAHCICHGTPHQRASRRYSAGMINLRPDQDGKIVGYEGVEKVQSKVGQHIIDFHFPPPGSATAAVSGGYMVNAWMRLRHPDYDGLREVMDFVGSTIKVRAA